MRLRYYRFLCKITQFLYLFQIISLESKRLFNDYLFAVLDVEAPFK